MLLVAENGKGEGKKEAEEREAEETKRVIGERRYIVWVCLGYITFQIFQKKKVPDQFKACVNVKE